MAYGYLTATKKALNKGLKKNRQMKNLNKIKIYKGPKGGPIVRRSLLSVYEMAKKGGPVKNKKIKLKKK